MLLIISLLLIIACKKKQSAVTATETETVTAADRGNASPNSAASIETVAKRPQYYVRSSLSDDLQDDALMRRMDLETSPYTQIEAVGWSAKGLFAYRYQYLHEAVIGTVGFTH
jgi:phage tail sheath gpL-like